MQKSILAHMTWEEFRDSVAPETVVLIPMGSMELEGPHLPLGVDTLVAESVAGSLAGEDGIVIGPAIPIGYSKWFKPFPGTISLESDTLTRVITEYCQSLVDHGICKFVFLNSHRGNNAAIEVAARSLIADHGVRIGMLSVWKLANDLIAGKDLIDEEKFTHAGEIMTSVIMAVNPETVVMEKIRADAVASPESSAFVVKNSLGETQFRNAVQTVFQDIRDITATGTMGNPETASADKGQAVLELIADYARAFLQEFRKLPVALKGKDRR